MKNKHEISWEAGTEPTGCPHAEYPHGCRGGRWICSCGWKSSWAGCGNQPYQAAEMERHAAEAKEFAERVWELTGMRLADIPWGRRGDACRHILARNGNLVVVGYDDYPDEDEDGNIFFSTFRKVDLSPDKQ